jgi:hypothetical protein
MSGTIILEPTARHGIAASAVWRPLDTLAGKVVGFIDNSKPNFHHLADDLSRLLTKTPAGRFAAKDYARAQHRRKPELGDIGPNTLLPISTTPEEIGIVVAGGPGTHSVYVPTFGQTRAVTRAIDVEP